jgi:hypothetical protein
MWSLQVVVINHCGLVEAKNYRMFTLRAQVSKISRKHKSSSYREYHRFEEWLNDSSESPLGRQAIYRCHGVVACAGNRKQHQGDR